MYTQELVHVKLNRLVAVFKLPYKAKFGFRKINYKLYNTTGQKQPNSTMNDNYKSFDVHMISIFKIITFNKVRIISFEIDIYFNFFLISKKLQKPR